MAKQSLKTEYIYRSDWSNDVKSAINDFIADSNSFKRYAVFDFDNTCTIFDSEEQLAIYQLEHMAFAFGPDEIRDILKSGLIQLDRDLTCYGFGSGSYGDWFSDIVAAFDNLYNKYGPFTASGVDDSYLCTLHADPDWQEFATKFRALYDLICEEASSEVAYPWLTYWLTGMNTKEIYNLTLRSDSYYSKMPTAEVLCQSSDVESSVGKVSYTFINGISVTENIKELMRVLNSNGIDVWICSASQIDVVCASVDGFGLKDFVTGIVAMTDKTSNGKIINEYDYKGNAYVKDSNGNWTLDKYEVGVQTQGIGKAKAIENVLYSRYGHGPNAAFMDSTGDFNFATEFKSLNLVVCFNRANRKVTDGGGLIAEVAMYQKQCLGYDYSKAKRSSDTLFVLQGRDENGTRSFINSNATVKFGESIAKLFAGNENYACLEYMKSHRLSTKDSLEKFAVKTADDRELGFPYGFLNKYSGYHCRD